MSADDPERLLTARDLAEIYRVDEKTIRRWTIAGDFDDCVIRTPGGQLRYRSAAVRERTQTSGPVNLSPPGGAGPDPTTQRPEGTTMKPQPQPEPKPEQTRKPNGPV